MNRQPISNKTIIVWRVQYTIIFIFITILINIFGQFNTRLYNLFSILNLLTYFIIIVIIIPLEFRQSSYIINNNYFRVNKGVLFKKSMLINIDEVQYIKVSQTIVQRFSKTCTLSFFTSGNKISLGPLDFRIAMNIKRQLYYGVS